MARRASCLLLLALGCATTRPDAARERVDELSSERLDRELAWTPSLETDPQVEAMVDRLLSESLTANAAVQIALVRSPRIQATLEELGIAQADLVQAGLLRNPHIGGGPRMPFGGTPVGWSFDTAIAFLDAALIPLRKKIAKAQRNHAILKVAHEVLMLDAEVREAFYDYVAIIQIYKYQWDIAEAAELANELAARQLAAGTMNELEAGEIAAHYQEAKLELSHVQNEVFEHREHLNRLMGLWGEDLEWRTAPELPKLPKAEPELERLESLAVASRLDLEAKRVEVKGIVHAVKLARRSPWLRAADVGVLGEQDPGDRPTLGPFIELELPIFDWGRADAARAEAELRMVQRTLQAMAIDVRSHVREKRNHMLIERRMTEFQRDVVIGQRHDNLRFGQQRYDAMLLGTYELLELKREELEARQAFVEHLRDYWIARTELELEVGGRLEALLARTARTKSNPGKK